jgi:tetratricopeptide (TPR) repeat protein
MSQSDTRAGTDPRYSKLPEAASLLRRGQIREAEVLLSSVLREYGDHPVALYMLGLAHLQLGQIASGHDLIDRSLRLDGDSANTWNAKGIALCRLGHFEAGIAAFEKAVQLNPTHRDALKNLGTVLTDLHNSRAAVRYFERLLEIEPQSADYAWQLGVAQYRAGDLAPAQTSLRQALAMDSRHLGAKLALGEVHESDGRFEEARAQYLEVLDKEPQNLSALSKLILLKSGKIEDHVLRRATDICENPAVEAARKARLEIALAHYYDRIEQYDRAFDYLRRGNEHLPRKAVHDSDEFSRAIDRLIAVFTPALFSARKGSDVADEEKLILIVGMPRSGTTLTEQILSSHSMVTAGGEMAASAVIGTRVAQLNSAGLPYPDGVRMLDDAALDLLADEYRRRLDQVGAEAARVTDKLPFNFMHLGFILYLIPNARVVHCRRDPLDNCVSCYFTRFADEVVFSNNLRTLGRYYLDYERVMAHWSHLLRGRIFELQYEDLIAEPEEKIRQLLDYCGLPWEDACMRFYRTERSVKTPSRWQVRQPIYTSSIGRWKNYERHIAELRDILGRG